MIKTLEELEDLEIGTKVKDRLGDIWVRGVYDRTHNSFGDYEDHGLWFGSETSGDFESFTSDTPYTEVQLMEWYGPFEVVDNG